LTVFGRGGFGPPKGEDRLDLHALDLRCADFMFAHLEGAWLEDSHLEGAYLGFAHLENAILLSAHLARADLAGTHLEGALLIAAHLGGAHDLLSAHLTGAVANDYTSWPDEFDWHAEGVVHAGEDYRNHVPTGVDS
jgi:uncharacterized protein YjbI with pentapeptide repeats